MRASVYLLYKYSTPDEVRASRRLPTQAQAQRRMRVHREAGRLLRHRYTSIQSASRTKKVTRAIFALPKPVPMIQREWETSTVAACAPLSGGRPWASTALTVTVNVASAVDSLEVTTNSDVPEPPPVTVAEVGFAQDGPGWPTPETAQVKSILPVKPLNGMTVMVEVADPVLMALGVKSVKVML